MGFKCCLVLLLAVLSATQGPPTQSRSADGSEQFVNQQLLQSREASMREDFERALHPWVQEELQMSEKNSVLQFSESFLLQLGPGQEHEFRWPIKTKYTHFQIKIRVFTQESGDDIVIIKNPDEDCRVDAFFKKTIDEDYLPLTSVYLQKVSHVMARDQGVFIMLLNTHPITVIVQISLQREPIKIQELSILKNDQMKIPASKLEAILAEMRVTESNRKWQYKWQWGFLERQEHYEQEMLKLTVSEAIIILATAVVQMYCIKALLDHNNVI